MIPLGASAVLQPQRQLVSSRRCRLSLTKRFHPATAPVHPATALFHRVRRTESRVQPLFQLATRPIWPATINFPIGSGQFSHTGSRLDRPVNESVTVAGALIATDGALAAPIS